MWLIFMLWIVALAVVVEKSYAQATPFVSGAVLMPGSGYNAGFSVGSGVEIQSKRVFSRFSAEGQFQAKEDVGDGRAVLGTGEFYYGWRTFKAGGGFEVGHLATSKYSKSIVYPMVGAAVNYRDNVFLVDYLFHGIDQNGLQGVKARALLRINDRFRLTIGVGAYSVYPSNQPWLPRQTVAYSSVGMEYRFKGWTR